MKDDILPVIGSAALRLRLFNEETALVISDLHLGFESSLAEKGITVPPQSRKLLGSIIQLCKKEKASRLIFIGDVKASESKSYPEEWQEIPYFFDKLVSEALSIDVVPGNHDGGLELMLPSGVEFHSPRGMAIETAGGRRVGLFHGHAWPAPELFSSDFLIIGHNHWAVELRDKQGARVREPVWVVAKAELNALLKAFLNFSSISYTDPIEAFRAKFGEEPVEPFVISMPAYNPFLRGRPINVKNNGSSFGLGPLLKEKILLIGDAEVFMLDGTYLGKVSQLSSLLVLGRSGPLQS